MATKPILIAGEPLDLLCQTIPSLTTEHCRGTIWRVSFPADTEQGAAWGRAIERYAADLLTAEDHIPIDQRRSAAFTRIANEIAAATKFGV